MALLCRVHGHRPNGRYSDDTGDMRSRCGRCGVHLVMYGPRDWRIVEVAHRRLSLRVVLAAVARQLRCRFGRHRAAEDFARWVSLPSGEGYHLSHCRDCSAKLSRLPGEAWRGAAD